MPQRNIAVIGAGPKAAALAAKAYCLQQKGVEVAVTIFERFAIGSAWSGQHGYTDGIQRLCTPAERDLGYPYAVGLGADVAQLMQERFSWNAFLTAQQRPVARYSEWVNRGRLPPSHAEFAEYLGHAIEMSGAEVYYGKVEEISLADGSWTVSQLETQSETAYEYDEFDGIVFTGAGPASRKFPRVRDPRVFTGVDFWRRLVGVRKNMPSSPDKPIVIIGGGGTAAAITAWFIRNGYGDKPIQLINNQAMLFTRTTNFFENRLFDDDDTWAALPDKERKSFTQRLNRGVVWETVTGLLSEARQLSLLPGFAKEVRYSGHRPGAHRADLEVCYENALGETSIDAGLVVDATGFDSWAFDRLLPAPVRTRIDLVGRENLTNQLRDDLSLPLDDLPKLHVPNLSETCGPGFGSLMVLGAMADRILSAYLDP